MAAQLEGVERGAGDGYRRFLKMARSHLRMGVPYFIVSWCFATLVHCCTLTVLPCCCRLDRSRRQLAFGWCLGACCRLAVPTWLHAIVPSLLSLQDRDFEELANAKGLQVRQQRRAPLVG